MSNRTLAIFSGAAKGARQASSNLLNIMFAANKLKESKKISDQEYKLNDMKIKKAAQEAQAQKMIWDSVVKRSGGAIVQSAFGGGEGQSRGGGFLASRASEPVPNTGDIVATAQDMGITDLYGVGIPKKRPVDEVIKEKIAGGQELTPSERIYADKFILKGRNIADPTDLSPEQQVQARALARKMYGVRGAEYGLPNIYQLMREGKTIDDIEDSLRYSGQSSEFTGPIRNAAQTMLLGTDANKAQLAMDFIDDRLSGGDTEGVKSQLKALARQKASAGMRDQIYGKETTMKLLDDISEDLDTLKNKGFDTNIFTGTLEQIAGKVGAVRNPELRSLATKILKTFQTYRRSMTGVAFNINESKEYAQMFPGIGKVRNLNMANIKALKESFDTELKEFYSLSMGEDNYRKIFEAEGKSQKKTENQGINQQNEIDQKLSEAGFTPEQIAEYKKLKGIE